MVTDTSAGATSHRHIGHVPAFDGVRGVAVLMVLLTHTPALINIFEDRIFHNSFLDGFVTGGFIGVDIFFVLSGFLITALALREHDHTNHISLGAFYRRRALRLLPALVLLLAAHMVYTIAEHMSVARERASDVSALFYFLNYRMTASESHVSAGLTHLWSLSVEEQFYIVWPVTLVVLLAVPRLRRWFVPITLAGIVLITLRRAELWHYTHNWTKVVWRADTRVDAMLIGALAAWLWTRRRTPVRLAQPLGWIAAIVLAINVQRSHVDKAWPYLGGYTVYAVCTVFIILAVLDSDWAPNRLLAWEPLALIGRVSYGLYIWHLAVFFAVVDWGPHWGAPTRVVVAYALTAALTAFSYTCVERPALRWKNRLELRRLDAHRPVGLDEHR